MKKNLLNLSNRLARRATVHSLKNNFVRSRFYCWASIAILELKWRLA